MEIKKKLDYKTNIFCLNENQTFDIKNQKCLQKYIKVDVNKMEKYIQTIKNNKYEYENDEYPCQIKMHKDIMIAKDKLLEASKRFNLKIKTSVFIDVAGKKICLLKGKEENRIITCSMDNKLLRRILDKKAHWNNAEIGTHINFYRSPNKMEPDVHTIMNFFHL